MPCQCETYECITIAVKDCNQWVELPVVANETGTFQISVDFNGMVQVQNFDAEVGEKMIIPNLFNSQFTHKVLIYPPGETEPLCYKIRTIPASWFIPLPSPPQIADESDVFYVIAAGDAPPLLNGGGILRNYSNGATFVVPELIGAVITDLRIGPASVEPVEGGYSFNPTTGAIVFSYPVEDSNIYIEATTGEITPTENDSFTYTLPFNLA